MYLGIYSIPTYIFNPIWADTISDKIPQKIQNDILYI